MIDKIVVKTYFMEDDKIVKKEGGAVAIGQDFAAVDQLFEVCKKETKQRIKELYSNEN